MRTSDEIRAIFESKGCTVEVLRLGTSYRAGGQILIYSPGISITLEQGVTVAKADFNAFDGTGYDNRGRLFQVFILTEGDYILATAAEFGNAAEDKRIQFGDETKSYSNIIYLVHRDELSRTGLADLDTAFSLLGI